MSRSEKGGRLETADCVVVGAGVVGLACARALALCGRDVVVLEEEGAIGSGSSSRNSEVIHAGIYYPHGSLKAAACVEGRRRLYAYCADKGVAHNKCGKLIVANDETQVALMGDLLAFAQANGVENIAWIDAEAAHALEPALSCRGALFSRETGIIDSHGYMLSLQGDLEDAGGMIAFETAVLGGAVTRDGIVLRARSQGAEMEFLARWVVNSAGLSAGALLAAVDGFPARFAPDVRYAKGNYFSLSGPSPFSRLVYPAPEPGGLGVHLTLDLAGHARFGPDVEWVDTLDYDVDPGRGDRFYAEIRKYWPGLPDGALAPAYAGVRPKLAGPGEPAADFRIDGPAVHGVPGLVNLLGIESPGLTASLVLAQLVQKAFDEAALARGAA